MTTEGSVEEARSQSPRKRAILLLAAVVLGLVFAAFAPPRLGCGAGPRVTHLPRREGHRRPGGGGRRRRDRTVAEGDPQQVMARATGNYKRGNERA